MNEGVLLVGHGTRSERGGRQFLVLAEQLAEALQPAMVEPAFLELRQPGIDAAVARLVGRGINRLVTVPVLLFAAGHAKQDIPSAVAAAMTQHGLAGIEQRQAAPLGCHPAIIKLAQLRLAAALPSQTDGHGCLCLLVGRGSSDEAAAAELREFAWLAMPRLDGITIQLAFVAKSEPLLEDVLVEVAAENYRQVIVQPHLLFEGDVLKTIQEQVASAARRCPATKWVKTSVLADSPDTVTPATALIQTAIVDRYREASQCCGTNRP